MLQPDPLHTLWHTPIGVHRFAQADAVNDVLVRVFQTMRATAEAVTGSAPKPFYASSDDLLQRIRLAEWEQLVRFIVDSVRQTVVLANQGAWLADRAARHLVPNFQPWQSPRCPHPRQLLLVGRVLPAGRPA